MLRRLARFLAVAAPVIGLDQLTKAWARAALEAGPMPVVDGTVFLRLGYNPGVAFSLFTEAGGRWIFAALALAVAVGLAVHAARRPSRASLLGLLAAGAAGNAIDRLRDGAVTDFVVVRIAGHQWPAWNVADAALVVGVLA